MFPPGECADVGTTTQPPAVHGDIGVAAAYGVLLMLLSAVLPWLYFKQKGWL